VGFNLAFHKNNKPIDYNILTVIELTDLVKVVEVAPEVFWVGVNDWNRRVFDSFIPLPYGTSYNAYLIVGNEHTALVDTVNPGFEDLLLRKVSRVVKPETIDYVVMNHAEPDHAGGIPRVLATAQNAKLVATRRGIEMAGVYYGVPPERAVAVKDGDSIDLGGKTLRFLEAPWLHWPETMFTLQAERQVLLTCDFFGTHMASDRLFAEDVGDGLLKEAKKYYAEIMMPFTLFVQRALDKVAGLDVKVIAPSHGPIYRDPKRIIAAYEEWARGPLKPKVVIAYVSMWGNTEALTQAIVEAVAAEGVEAIPYNMVVADVAHVASDLVDAAAVLFGSPTLIGGPHPLIASLLEVLRCIRPRVKLGAVYGSYGWGGGAAAHLKNRLQSMGFEVMGTLEVRGKPGKEDLEKAAGLAQAVARKVKESVIKIK